MSLVYVEHNWAQNWGLINPVNSIYIYIIYIKYTYKKKQYVKWETILCFNVTKGYSLSDVKYHCLEDYNIVRTVFVHPTISCSFFFNVNTKRISGYWFFSLSTNNVFFTRNLTGYYYRNIGQILV